MIQDPGYDPFEGTGTQPGGKRKLRPADDPLDVDNARKAASAFERLAVQGDPERGGQYKKKRRPDDHNPRTADLWRARGYHVEKVEITRILPGGAFLKTDLLGIADFLCLKPGKAVFVQACALAQLGPHLRKYRDLPAARLLLSIPGILVVITTWDQPDGPKTRWIHGDVRVTDEILDAYEARRRK